MNISKFAREIGVSPTTVSHALSGQGRLSQKTRLKVLQKAEAMGYTPNYHAQRLATGRTGFIGLEWISEKLLADQYAMAMARDLQQAMQPYGYNLTFNLVSDLETQNELLRSWAKSHAVDGVVSLGHFLDDPEVLSEIASPQTPCVVITNTAIRNVLYAGSVVLGVERGMHELAQLFVQHGHTRIGYIGHENKDSKMLQSLRRALEQLRVALPEENMAFVAGSIEGAAEGLRRLMALPQPPTAIFARNDTIALGVLREAHRMGLRVPTDLSLAGHDDSVLVDLAEPSLTTVRIDSPRVARLAIEMLMDLRARPDQESGAEPQLVETELVVRDSVGPVPTIR